MISGPTYTIPNSYQSGSVYGTGSGYGSGYSQGVAGAFGSGSGYGSSYGLLNSGYGSVNYGSHGGAYHDSSYAGNYGHTTVVKQTSPLVSHKTYVYSAPEDKENYQRDQTIVLPRPKQHYNVVFIKSPSTTVVNNPAAALGQQAQEKTLIYVVNDKKRIENHIDVPEVDRVKPQKPEVFFIKRNLPTQVVNSKIKYETVGAINGAEYGAVNGIPNRVSADSGLFEDETANKSPGAAIASAIQTQGNNAVLNTINSFGGGFNSFLGLFGGLADQQYTSFGNQNYQPNTGYSAYPY